MVWATENNARSENSGPTIRNNIEPLSIKDFGRVPSGQEPDSRKKDKYPAYLNGIK